MYPIEDIKSFFRLNVPLGIINDGRFLQENAGVLTGAASSDLWNN